MKVYVVYRVTEGEDWMLMKIFRTSEAAWSYHGYRTYLQEPVEVSYIVQEEDVE